MKRIDKLVYVGFPLDFQSRVVVFGSPVYVVGKVTVVCNEDVPAQFMAQVD